MEIPKFLENVADKDYLSNRLQFLALFIALYEKIIDFAEETVKDFLCNGIHIDNGVPKVIESERYKKVITNRVIDDKGNKNKTKASFLYLVETGIISNEDISLVEQARKKRNSYVHEMFSSIINDINEEDYELFFQMIKLFDKMTKNWFIEVEAPIEGIELTEEIKEETTQLEVGLFCLALQSLFIDSESLKENIEKAKNGEL